MATFAPGMASGRDNAADEPAPGADGGPEDGGAKRKSTRRLSAAFTEFGGARSPGPQTADIAARAGVSQPYVYALFPDKQALFLACHDWTTERIKEALEKASADLVTGDDVEQALDRAYKELFDKRPHQVLFQVQ